MKLLHIQKRDNVEFYLCCKFQLSPFSVRRKTDVKDGVTDWQTNELPYASALGITNELPYASALFAIAYSRDSRTCCAMQDGGVGFDTCW